MFKRRRPLSSLERWRQYVWPREGWLRALTYSWRRVLRLRSSIHSIALGLAIGAFISASPLLGTHFLWAGLIAWLFGANILSSALGTWVGNPFTFPFIWVATYKSGSFILGLPQQSLALPEISFSLLLDTPSTLLPFIGPMMIGMFPVGLILAVATYYPSFWIIKTYQKRRRRLVLKRKNRNLRRQKPADKKDRL